MKDEHVIVLDFLSKGTMGMKKAEPVAQVIGEKWFSLLEIVLKEDVKVKPGDRLYIGEGKRDEVKYIKERIDYDKLTNVAKDTVEPIIRKLVERNEERFVDFYNKSDSITTRLHALELLPGIGKKHMWEILNKRKEKKFESFQDIKDRVKLIPDPKEAIVKRVIDELHQKDRYHIFSPKMVRY